MAIKFSILFFSLVSWLMAGAQDPVQWKNWVKKTGVGTYEIHCAAAVQSPWHLYSQVQPKDAIPLPTQVRFQPNPLVSLVGKTKELGQLETHTDQTLGSTDRRFAGNVDFVQVVRAKANIRTNVSVAISYQVCTNEQCLPPKTVALQFKLE